ncbi:MAG: thiamine pyrophosphate-binding protein [Acidothermales bacterium]|nr:thiamine pyrophosphate-binding protein [Acidothermales bacterium]
MIVAEAVGRTLARLGVRRVFGVVGSGNFHVTNALVDGGARFVAARHECGATMMADAYARVSGEVSAVSLHQGCGLTNALTGITEAAKSRTPLLVLAADTGGAAVRSNFRIDQDAVAVAVGAVAERTHTPASALADTVRAYRRAVTERRTVVLNLPLDVQAAECPGGLDAAPVPSVPARPAPAPEAVRELGDLLGAARRPVFLAGRGAVVSDARDALVELADACGALLGTSAVANGLFHGEPWSLGISGGFASPLAAELIEGADLLVGWGCSLTMWTTRHGRLVGADTRVVQVDLDVDQIGANHPVALGVLGDVRETAVAVAADLADRGHTATGYRSPELRDRIAAEGRWRDLAYDDESTADLIDPRTLTIGLDGLLPAERVVAVDSGNFMGYPAAFLTVPDERGFCFTQSFQSVGLGLGTAVGAALARPDRLPVAALGDGGALMAAAELETVARLRLPMLVVVYDDAAYGAEVHHFGPDGLPLHTVRFPDTDIAAIAAGHGFDAVTVRRRSDLDAVRAWVAGPRDRPMLVDAKVVADHGAWWLEEAFRGH